MQSLGTGDAFLHTHLKVEPFKEKFGQRFVARCESVNFRLQAPVDGDKGPLGQVRISVYTLNQKNCDSLLLLIQFFFKFYTHILTYFISLSID